MSGAIREVELKARVDDVDAARRNIETAGAILVFEGELLDRVYDTPNRELQAEDQVLRLRMYANAAGVSAHLEWKGRTSRDGGFKVRTELGTGVSDGDATAELLDRLGYAVVRSIDRHVAQYEHTAAGAAGLVVIRFETYPRMDDLVEIEGPPEAIERAITTLGIARDRFSADRLTDFVAAYEARTRQRAVVSRSALQAEARKAD